MRSGSTGRLRSAICTERRSLSRSNGTRRPLRLITVSSRNCTRSNVVKRKLQARHTRRRRMTEESSVGRESFTWVSRLAQFGQRIAGASIYYLEKVPIGAPRIRLPSPPAGEGGEPSERSEDGEPGEGSLRLSSSEDNPSPASLANARSAPSPARGEGKSLRLGRLYSYSSVFASRSG